MEEGLRYFGVLILASSKEGYQERSIRKSDSRSGLFGASYFCDCRGYVGRPTKMGGRPQLLVSLTAPTPIRCRHTREFARHHKYIQRSYRVQVCILATF